MKEAFLEQQVSFDIYTVSIRDIKNHFIAYLFDKGRSDNTVSGRIKAIKQFFKYLFEEGWRTENIANDLHVVKAKKLMIQTFTKEQVVSIFEQRDKKTFTGYRDFTMMMLLETGMRMGELCHLKKGYIFFKNWRFKLRREKANGHAEYRSNKPAGKSFANTWTYEATWKRIPCSSTWTTNKSVHEPCKTKCRHTVRWHKSPTLEFHRIRSGILCPNSIF